VHPRATYRLQLHAGFDFDAAAAIVPYLAELGVSHIYCSPYLQATRGSTHGYDVVDHSRISAELGGAAGHERFLAALAGAGMSHILDIVPNHMARDSRDNLWWRDVLENGPASRYADHFDIDWDGEADKNRYTVLMPILADHFGRVLEAGEITVHRAGGAFNVVYGEAEVPLSPRTLDELLDAAAAASGCAELAELAGEFGRLPHARLSDRAAVTRRHEQKELLGERLANLCLADPDVASYVDAEVARINADPDALDALLSRQNYRLAYWTTASEELDYRRFFTIDSLIGLRVEDEAVFDNTHVLILDLVRRGAITGLRVDHVDGLRDPQAYLQRLRRSTGGIWTVVEKILAPDEKLPEDWPVGGTTGYDFAVAVDNVLVDPAAENEVNECWFEFLEIEADSPDPVARVAFPEVIAEAKQQLMRTDLAAEMALLVRLLAAVCERHRRHRDHTRAQLREAVIEYLAALGVYRTYCSPGREVSVADRREIRAALARARVNRPDIDSELLQFISEVLLLEHPGRDESEFALRFAQASAPVMAKGAEDTAFYRYHRLISLNEVGGDPGIFGRPTAAFHAACSQTARNWPTTLLTLSTHDTKRSSDARARISALAEVPAAWQAAVLRWAKHNEAHRTGTWPDRSIEYLLYQTLVGLWPVAPPRVVEFMRKAAREAKVHTSWERPNAGYEAAVEDFCTAVLDDEAFRRELKEFLCGSGIPTAGRINSLAATTLLLTCPGIPDIYQGDELWNTLTVDPDNRRPVDFEHRREVLARMREADARTAANHLDDGGAKLWLITRLLHLRRRFPQLFDSPWYEGIEARGPKAVHALAFSRGDLVTVVPRLPLGLAGDWADTELPLPPGRWMDELAGNSRGPGPIALRDLLADFPVAVLTRVG